MLREQTPPVLAGKPMIELGEDHAVIRASLADITGGPVQLRWRVANSDSAWQSVALTPMQPGALSAQLDSLAVFVDHEFFVQSTPQGEVTSEPRKIRPQKTGIIYSTGFEPIEPVAFPPGAITTKRGRGVWPWAGPGANQSRRAWRQAVRAGDCVIEMTLKKTGENTLGRCLHSGSRHQPGA